MEKRRGEDVNQTRWKTEQNEQKEETMNKEGIFEGNICQDNFEMANWTRKIMSWREQNMNRVERTKAVKLMARRNRQQIERGERMNWKNAGQIMEWQQMEKKDMKRKNENPPNLSFSFL